MRNTRSHAVPTPEPVSSSISVGEARGNRRYWPRDWRGRSSRSLAAVAPLGFCLLVLLALWQWGASRSETDTLLLPSPLAVASVLLEQRDQLWTNTLVTLFETALGFGAALLVGIVFATLMDFSSWVRRGIYPLLVMSQTIPFVAIAPLLVLWFGFDLFPKIVLITLVCFFPITVALTDGLQATDPEAIKLYRSFGARPWRIFWSLRLPGAVPALFSGIRIAVSYSLLSALFSEYIGSTEGLGFFMQLSQHAFSTAGVLAAVVVIALLTAGLFGLTHLVERLAIPWYFIHRRATSRTSRTERNVSDR